MSSRVAKRALLDSKDLRPTERLVLLAVALHADDAGRNAFPSVDTVADYANVSRRTVQRALARLVELGHLGDPVRWQGYERLCRTATVSG
jgi:hypothetical protein